MCDQHEYSFLQDAAGNTGCHIYVNNSKLCHNPMFWTGNQKCRDNAFKELFYPSSVSTPYREATERHRDYVRHFLDFTATKKSSFSGFLVFLKTFKARIDENHSKLRSQSYDDSHDLSFVRQRFLIQQVLANIEEKMQLVEQMLSVIANTNTRRTALNMPVSEMKKMRVKLTAVEKEVATDLQKLSEK